MGGQTNSIIPQTKNKKQFLVTDTGRRQEQINQAEEFNSVSQGVPSEFIIKNSDNYFTQRAKQRGAEKLKQEAIKGNFKNLAAQNQSIDAADKRKTDAEAKAGLLRNKIKEQAAFDANAVISLKGIPADASIQDSKDLPDQTGLTPPTRGGLQSALAKKPTEFPIINDLIADPSIQDISKNSFPPSQPSLTDIQREKNDALTRNTKLKNLCLVFLIH